MSTSKREMPEIARYHARYRVCRGGAGVKVGIIGATGWLGSALGGGLLEAGSVATADLVLLNRSGPRAEYHSARDVVWARDVTDLVERAEVVVVAVRPQDWDGLALAAPGRLLISFMACVSVAALARSGARIVRAMPNAAAELGRSYTPWLAGPGVTDDDRAATRAILSAIGTEDQVASEAQIDFLTALSGSGAAYPALMALAMLDAAREVSSMRGSRNAPSPPWFATALQCSKAGSGTRPR